MENSCTYDTALNDLEQGKPTHALVRSGYSPVSGLSRGVFTIPVPIMGLAGFCSADSVKTRATVNRVAVASSLHIQRVWSFPHAIGESTEKKQLGNTRVVRTNI